MYLCDTHTHSRWSFDGTETIRTMCEAAIAAGLNGLVVTDHYDIDGIEDGFYPEFDRQSCEDEIEAAKEEFAGRLDLFRGVELGQPYTRRDNAAAFLRDGRFDFVIGSAHNLDRVPDFSAIDYSTFNETHKLCLYRRMLKEIAGITDFPEIRTAAHLSYPLRYIMKHCGSLPDYTKLKDDFAELFGILIGHGVAVELNTAGLWRGLLPAEVERWILSLYRDCGGELVTVGSDAHRAKDIAKMVAEGYAMLREIGFRYVVTPAGMKEI